MDKLGRLEVEQLKVTSTTPPADSGLYKIDETTMGVVGDLKFRHPKTGAMSSALTVTSTSAQEVDKFGFTRQVGSVMVLRSSAADSIGAAVATVQKLDSFKIPAGALESGDTLRFTLGLLKSGASDTATFKVCVGTTDSASDATMVTPVLATSATTYGAIHAFKVVSSTALRQVGVTSGNNSLPGTSANTAAAPVTVGDLSASGIYVGLYCTMTSGSEFPTMRSLIVELIPRA